MDIESYIGSVLDVTTNFYDALTDKEKEKINSIDDAITIMQKKGERMSDIKFYVPESETIPTNLRLYVDDVYMWYERIDGGFRFHINTLDENEALELAKIVIDKMRYEHDESEHGVSWQTVSLDIIPKENIFQIYTIIEWKYHVRDSYYKCIFI